MKVGITGHRNFFDPSVMPWVEQCINATLNKCAFLQGFSSLAKGSDQIFARAVLALGGPLEAVLPFPTYGESFDDAEEKAGFDDLIGRCSKIITLQFAGSIEKSYLAAGQYIAEHCDLLIAVWDGKAAAGIGGTADVVNYALKWGKAVHQINPLSRTSSELLVAGS